MDFPDMFYFAVGVIGNIVAGVIAFKLLATSVRVRAKTTGYQPVVTDSPICPWCGIPRKPNGSYCHACGKHVYAVPVMRAEDERQHSELAQLIASMYKPFIFVSSASSTNGVAWDYPRFS